MSGTETPSSSPITSASLKSNSLFKGDVSQEVIDMMAKIGVSLKGDMLCQTSTNEELMDFHGGHSHHVDNQAIYLCVYQGAVTIPGEDARVLRIGGLDDANTYWYSNISSDIAGRVNLGEKKIVTGREEMKSHGFSLPNSSAIALSMIPGKLVAELSVLSREQELATLNEMFGYIRQLAPLPHDADDSLYDERKELMQPIASRINDFIYKSRKGKILFIDGDDEYVLQNVICDDDGTLHFTEEMDDEGDIDRIKQEMQIRIEKNSSEGARAESNDICVVPGVKDLEAKVAEVKALGATILDEGYLTKLKKANKELATMLSEFLDVKGNEIYAQYRDNHAKQKIKEVSFSEDAGITLLGEIDAWFFDVWSDFSFHNEGSIKLGLVEGRKGLQYSLPDQV